MTTKAVADCVCHHSDDGVRSIDLGAGVGSIFGEEFVAKIGVVCKTLIGLYRGKWTAERDHSCDQHSIVNRDVD